MNARLGTPETIEEQLLRLIRLNPGIGTAGLWARVEPRFSSALTVRQFGLILGELEESGRVCQGTRRSWYPCR